MLETDEDLTALDELIERSFGGANSHLTSIMTSDRRLSARDLARYLTGVRHLVVATTTRAGEPRCSAADGLFIHGHFWFTTSGTSSKVRHLEQRSALSVAHVVGDDVGVFVHGHARLVVGASDEAAALAPIWRDVYDSVPEDWTDQPDDARYIEVLPHAVFTYAFSRDRFEELVALGPAPRPASTE